MSVGALSSSSEAQPSPVHWAEAFREATAAISRYSGARAGDRTMMDALLPAAEAALQSATSGRGSAHIVAPGFHGSSSAPTGRSWIYRAESVDSQFTTHLIRDSDNEGTRAANFHAQGEDSLSPVEHGKLQPGDLTESGSLIDQMVNRLSTDSA